MTQMRGDRPRSMDNTRCGKAPKDYYRGPPINLAGSPILLGAGITGPPHRDQML